MHPYVHHSVRRRHYSREEHRGPGTVLSGHQDGVHRVSNRGAKRDLRVQVRAQGGADNRQDCVGGLQHPLRGADGDRL